MVSTLEACYHTTCAWYYLKAMIFKVCLIVALIIICWKTEEWVQDHNQITKCSFFHLYGKHFIFLWIYLQFLGYKRWQTGPSSSFLLCLSVKETWRKFDFFKFPASTSLKALKENILSAVYTEKSHFLALLSLLHLCKTLWTLIVKFYISVHLIIYPPLQIRVTVPVGKFGFPLQSVCCPCCACMHSYIHPACCSRCNRHLCQ